MVVGQRADVSKHRTIRFVRSDFLKRMTAREILAESFRELAENKSIDKITVKDITENCGYSSATFYRNFKDKYDLIAWEYSNHVSGIMSKIGVDGYSWRHSLEDGARSFLERKNYLANLFLHTSGHDAFIQYQTEINYNAFRNFVVKSPEQTQIDEKTDMYIRLYCLGTVSLTCEWILGKYRATCEEMAEVYENSLPAPLKKYVY